MAEFLLDNIRTACYFGRCFAFFAVTETVTYQFYDLQFPFPLLRERWEEFIADIDEESDLFFIFLQFPFF